MGNPPTDRILIVGIPATGAAGLSPSVLSRLQAAEVLCGAARHLAAFPGIGADRWPITDNVPQLVERLRAVGHKRIVVLASGDPLLFGIGGTLVRSLGADRVEIVPAVSAAQEAFARVCLPWHDVRIVSAHGRPIEPVVAAVLAHPHVAVYTDPVHTPARLAAAVLAAGSRDRRVVIAERLGASDERVSDTTLREIGERACDPLNVMLILEAVAEPTPPGSNGPAGDDAAFVSLRGQMTPREVRALSLSRLDGGAAHVLWDIGAGSGAIAIDMARRNPAAKVFAVERDPDQHRCIRTNLERCRVRSVTVVEGEAPEVLDDLPDPQAVFIGGTGGRLTAVLDRCWSRVAAGGRIVANLVVFDHVSDVLRWGAAQGVMPDVLHVQLARGVPIVGSVRLDALNPVFIVTIDKPSAGPCASERGGGS